MNLLKTVQIENEMGISGTFYFRMVLESFEEKVIRKIQNLGREIGCCHYEDVSWLAVCSMRS